MTEQDYICALKSIMGQARMMVKDIEGKKPSDAPHRKHHKEPHIKVEAWYWGYPRHMVSGDYECCGNIVRYTYTFTGQPDWKRIIRETFGKGADVVRVTPVKGVARAHSGVDMRCATGDNLLIAKYPVKNTFDGAFCLKSYYLAWEYQGISDADIEAAIREHHKADAPKSAHKKGERFEGICQSELPSGYHQEYAGELRAVREGEHYEYGRYNGIRYSTIAPADWPWPYEILTLVPDEPEPKYKVGQWVATDMNPPATRIGQITGYDYTYDCWCIKLLNGTMTKWMGGSIRPAVPSDFDVRVGNMKVRAYEYNSIFGGVYLRWSDGSSSAVSTVVAAALGYPVCPLSVSHGNFETPKGELRARIFWYRCIWYKNAAKLWNPVPFSECVWRVIYIND